MTGTRDFAMEFWRFVGGSLGLPLDEALTAQTNCEDHPLAWVINTASSYNFTRCG